MFLKIAISRVTEELFQVGALHIAQWPIASAASQKTKPGHSNIVDGV